MKGLKVFLCLITFCITSVDAFAVDVLKVKSGKAEFHAEAVGGTVNIDGKSAPLTGELKLDAGKVTGWVEADLTKLKTGMDLRDEHTHKYLGTAQYPKAKLVLDSSTLASDGTVNWTGKLTLKGQTKPVSGTATYKGEALATKFVVKLKDYPAIGAPSYNGLAVSDDVEVTVEAVVGK